MTHIKYNKVYHIDKEEVEGILSGPVTVQEKIDGANASIWLEDDEFRLGTRNNEVPNFRGLWEYVDKHEGIKKLLLDHPHCRLFGEWLVKHTLEYNPEAFGHFYLFDILDESAGEWMPPNIVKNIADIHGIQRPHVFIQGAKNLTKERIEQFLGQSRLGEKGEGVVIKRDDGFTNKFGVYPRHAKMITSDFAEENHATFGGNNKASPHYHEQYVVNTWLTWERVEKVVHKLEHTLDRQLDKSDTPRVAETVYHDMLTEEIWDIQKRVQGVKFKKLRDLCKKKAVKIFHAILDGEEKSVAFEQV
jgi:hypothetical protein